MMELAKQWLLGITGAAILAALTEGIMPEGGIKQVGKLACGLLLLTAVLKPFVGIELTTWSENLFRDIPEPHTLQEETQARMKQLIEEEFSAYSMEKAQMLGLTCDIYVHCQQEESGIFLPDGAEISGVTGAEGQEAVAVMLYTELGLSREGLLFKGGERK